MRENREGTTVAPAEPSDAEAGRKAIRTPEVSHAAECLLRVIRDLSRLRGYCWAAQGSLAKLMNRSPRSVRVYVAELVTAGKLRVERDPTYRTNRYYPIEPAGSCRSPGRILPPTRQELPPDRQDPAARPAESCHQNKEKDLKELDESSGSSAANESPPAAAASLRSKAEEAEAAFVALGCTAAPIRPYVAADPALAELAAAWLKGRLADRKKNPVRDVTAFAISVLRSPDKCGFERGPDGWKPPAAEGYAARAAQITQRLATTKNAAAALASDIDRGKADMAWYALQDRAWNALREDERVSIRFAVISERPAIAQDATKLHNACIRELARRQRRVRTTQPTNLARGTR